MSECPRHDDTTRRISVLEENNAEQIRENAKLWKAINVIREEKATDSAILKGLVVSVDELKTQLLEGLAELRAEIQALKAVPAKRWEMVIASVISAAVALVIGIFSTAVLTGKVTP